MELITPRARSIFRSVRGASALPDARYFVGRLLTGWRGEDGHYRMWGVHDDHNGEKISPRVSDYFESLRLGDKLYLFDDDWNAIASGPLGFESGADLHSELARPTMSGDSWIGQLNDEQLRVLWKERSNVIVVRAQTATDKIHWKYYGLPNYELYLRARKNPVVVTGAGFRYQLGHFERLVQGRVVIECVGDKFSIGMTSTTGWVSIRQGDMILLFDDKDQLVFSRKKLDSGRLWSLGSKERVAVGQAVRMVLIENHYGPPEF